MAKYTIGIDFGSLSGRTVVVDTTTGRELSCAALDYPHAVMSDTLPSGKPLPPAFALQHPADYLAVLDATIPAAIEKAGIDPLDIIGLGIDFTCCTMLPVDADNTPLCFLPDFADEPHAFVKMWKHHAAQPYADLMNRVARERGEEWLDRFGGSISSEWMAPKLLEILHAAPRVWESAQCFLEAGDWITRYLSGSTDRSYVLAAIKQLYVDGMGYPSNEYFAACDEGIRNAMQNKLGGNSLLLQGERTGTLRPELAACWGLSEKVVIASAMPDAHAAAPALGVCRAGDMFAVLGTSACFMMIDEKDVPVRGICGTVNNGILPRYYGYEAGLCCLGDHFAWAAQNLASTDYVKEAEARGISMLRLLIEKAAKRRVGEHPIIALNWFNGNRSTLINSKLSGSFVGMNLSTKPEDLMLALLQATAFGARNIIENFAAHGVPVRRLFASGGIARKDAFTMQMYADVLGMDILIPTTAQAPALGCAIAAAVAVGKEGGGYNSFDEAIAAMGSPLAEVYHPRAEMKDIYDELYREYKMLHDYFGKGGNDVMQRLFDMAERERSRN